MTYLYQIKKQAEACFLGILHILHYLCHFPSIFTILNDTVIFNETEKVFFYLSILESRMNFLSSHDALTLNL
jgi:hypothetical protein